MTKQEAIRHAQEIAYEQDCDQAVIYDSYFGWRVCDWEDMGAIAESEKEVVHVKSSWTFERPMDV